MKKRLYFTAIEAGAAIFVAAIGMLFMKSGMKSTDMFTGLAIVTAFASIATKVLYVEVAKEVKN